RLTLSVRVLPGNAMCGSRIPLVASASSALTFLWVKLLCEGRSRALYLLPAVMLLWVNLHAGFVLGYAILGIALFVEGARALLRRPGAMSLPRLRTMAAILAASVAVAIVNPNGWDIYLYS